MKPGRMSEVQREVVQARRRSGASGLHDSRPHRRRTRKAVRDAAVREQREA